MRPWSTVSISFLAFVLLTNAATQPQPPPPPAVPGLGETIEVSIVNLDVIVTDKQGNRVRGLTKDDFTILEDGKPQTIANFSEYGAESRAGVSTPETADAPALPDPTQKRTIVLFIDSFKLPPFRKDPIFDSLKKTVHGIIRKGDAVSIVRWNGEAITLLEATDDLAAVDKTLDELSQASTGVAPDGLTRMRMELAEIQSFRSRALAAMNARGWGVTGDNTGAPLDVRANAVWAKVELQKKTAVLKSLLLGLSGEQGKKAIFFLSHRFSMVAGLEFMILGGQNPIDPALRAEFDTERLVLSVADTANAAGVTLYPLYPEGLGQATFSDATTSMTDVVREATPTPDAAFDHRVLNNETPVLGSIARSTGGLSASGKDIVDLLPRAADDFTTYYSMAYRTETRRQDRKHKLAVTTKNPEYRIRTRGDYVEKSDETNVRERIISSLFGVRPESKIAIDAKVGKVTKTGRSRYTIPLRVSLPIEALTTIDQPNGDFAGSFSVYVAWGGILGEISDITQARQQFVIPRGDAEKAAQSTFTYDFDVLADERTERIAVAVLDDVGKDVGYFYITLPPRSQMMAEGK
ncbi:MAG: VWA domain-containing protein [Acidobacteria bacterium]|nr:VWA domain-containing protein [Acidobacteriota bacterium]